MKTKPTAHVDEAWRTLLTGDDLGCKNRDPLHVFTVEMTYNHDKGMRAIAVLE